VVDSKENGGGGYGSQRLWGTMAWGLGSWVVGGVIDQFGYSGMFTWTYVWSAVLVALLFCHPTTRPEVVTCEDSGPRVCQVQSKESGWDQAKSQVVQRPNGGHGNGQSDTVSENASAETTLLPNLHPPSTPSPHKASPIQQLRSLGRMLLSPSPIGAKAGTPPSPLRPFLIVVLTYGTVMVLVSPPPEKETFLN
jgi:hypothetical protein